MLKIRNLILVLGVLMSPLAVSDAQVSVGIGFPHVSIGFNVPAYPQTPQGRQGEQQRKGATKTRQVQEQEQQKGRDNERGRDRNY